MASELQSVDEDVVYFTPLESIAKAIQQRKLDPGKLKEKPEYGEYILDPPDQDHSNVPNTEYYEYDDIKTEYVLPQPNSTSSQSQSRVTPKPSKTRDVQDLYDEDGYALPDINNCVTIGAGIQKPADVERNVNISSEGKTCTFSDKKMKITGTVILLLVVSGIGGALVTVFTGITSLCF